MPNWQDSSTTSECQELEAALGGPEGLAQATGSKAHTRFTASQIMRFRRKEPEAYAATSRISLVSSFITTLLCLDGEIKGIDESDVCGMNLWDMGSERRGWKKEIVAVVAGDGDGGSDALLRKLGNVETDGGRVVGQVGSWYRSRYGFSKECVVLPGTGDNPATFLSLTREFFNGYPSPQADEPSTNSSSNHSISERFRSIGISRDIGRRSRFNSSVQSSP